MARRTYVLSEEGKRIFDLLKQEMRHELKNTTNRARQVDPNPFIQSPEVYVAKTPPGGISGISNDQPGSGVCDIYQLIRFGEEEEAILEVTGGFKRVYNLSKDPIAGGEWIAVWREKFGTWITFGADIPLGDETGTGTGTAGGDICAPITITQEKVECEDGTLNVYQRDLTLNISDGCLTKVTGGWVLNRSEGRCGDTTGTGTDRDDSVVIQINVEDITTYTDYILNTLYYNEADSTLNVFISGIGWKTWHTSSATVINYTDIRNFKSYTANRLYWNQADLSFYININGRWYEYCECDLTGTGTGTNTGGGNGGDTVTVGCCSNALSTTLTATITGKTGSCTCLPDTVTLTWSEADQLWQGEASDGCTIDLTLRCAVDENDCTDFQLTELTEGVLTQDSCSCDPLDLVYSHTATLICTGSFTVTITE